MQAQLGFVHHLLEDGLPRRLLEVALHLLIVAAPPPRRREFYTLFPPPPDQLVRRQIGIQYLARRFDPGHWERRGVEQADLDEHRRLIPVDPLADDVVVTDLTTTTRGTSTFRPVGATPGSIQSMTMSCVNEKIISSITRSRPTVRQTGVMAVSSGIFGMKCRP